LNIFFIHYGFSHTFYSSFIVSTGSFFSLVAVGIQKEHFAAQLKVIQSNKQTQYNDSLRSDLLHLTFLKFSYVFHMPELSKSQQSKKIKFYNSKWWQLWEILCLFIMLCENSYIPKCMDWTIILQTESVLIWINYWSSISQIIHDAIIFTLQYNKVNYKTYKILKLWNCKTMKLINYKIINYKTIKLSNYNNKIIKL